MSSFSSMPQAKVSYPVRFTYINKIANWWPPQKIAADLGVPGYANPHFFWTYQYGPLDIVSIWDDPVKYFGENNPFGKTKDQIQKNIKKRYNDNGIKIMISAFGATQFPTTQGVNPINCAQKLGNFVLKNNLDGVDIDWEDSGAMQKGTGEQWLITFMQRLRQIIPQHIVTHAPQAPYFSSSSYKNGAYVTVNQKVGNLIDFYNVQFYNQGNTTYDTYQKLFLFSGGFFPGTSVKQIYQRGIPLQKIVVGKPALQSDAYNTGYMDRNALSAAVLRGFKEGKWYGGVMFWQFSSDKSGQIIRTVISPLIQQLFPK